jgi:transcriptional regulator with XRE-family HTH domain
MMPRRLLQILLRFELANLLFLARQRSGVSLRKLARALGVSPERARAYELGRADPPMAQVYQATQVFERGRRPDFSARPELEALAFRTQITLAEAKRSRLKRMLLVVRSTLRVVRLAMPLAGRRFGARFPRAYRRVQSLSCSVISLSTSMRMEQLYSLISLPRPLFRSSTHWLGGKRRPKKRTTPRRWSR